MVFYIVQCFHTDFLSARCASGGSRPPAMHSQSESTPPQRVRIMSITTLLLPETSTTILLLLLQYHNYFYYCLTLLAPTSLSQWGRKLLHPCRITSEEIRKPPTRAPKPTNPGEEMPTETTETPTRGHKRSIPAGTTLTENMDKRGDPNGPSPEEKSLLN